MLIRLALLAVCTAALADAPYLPDARQWASATPAEAGMDARQLERGLLFAETHHSTGVVVLRGGKIVAERYWKGWTRDTRRDMYSAQKSVTSVLVGIAIERGLIPSLDTPAVTFFAAWKGTPKAAITVRHLLSMSSGLHSSKRSDLVQHMRAKDKTAFALGLELDHVPGSHWAYCNPAYGLTIALVAKAAGKSRQDFAREVLFGPLGMNASTAKLIPLPTKLRWLKLTHHGLETTCRDMARFGLMVSRGGRWGEKQIVPAKFLKAATRHSGTANHSYGYLWWLNSGKTHKLPYSDKLRPTRLFPNCPPDTVAALGAKDSKIYVVPSLDLVVTRLGGDAKAGGGVAPTGFDDGFLSRICEAVQKKNQ